MFRRQVALPRRGCPACREMERCVAAASLASQRHTHTHTRNDAAPRAPQEPEGVRAFGSHLNCFCLFLPVRWLAARHVRCAPSLYITASSRKFANTISRYILEACDGLVGEGPRARMEASLTSSVASSVLSSSMQSSYQHPPPINPEVLPSRARTQTRAGPHARVLRMRRVAQRDANDCAGGVRSRVRGGVVLPSASRVGVCQRRAAPVQQHCARGRVRFVPRCLGFEA